ncbi:MAG: hypothetical protein ACOYMZ_03830 [Minisyncoccia bacterium]
MNRWTVDIENKDKCYLNEKELFIIYWILKKRHISTGWSNVFTLDSKHTVVPKQINPSDIATIEEDINNAIVHSTKRIHDKMQSSTVLRYLLDTGKVFDEKGFIVYGDADYSLVEGGFLSEYVGATMQEYLEDTQENRQDVKRYGNLNDEQKVFLEEIIKGEDFDSIKFSQLAHPPVKEYRDAILNKEANEDFIELVNKLIPEYDGSKWNTEDIEKFLEIYYRHSKEEFKENSLTEKTFLYKDSQKKLAGLIFEHANFGLFIKNTEKLQKYFDTYLKSFTDDELEGLSRKGLTGTFFSEGLSIPLHTQFFGFKKQRDILIKHIEDKYEEYQRNDLEIGHPYFEPEYIGNYKDDTVKITLEKNDKIKDLFLFVHSMLSLEKEGYLKIEDFSYGPKQMFDLYDRGFVFKIRLNEKSENKSEQVWSYDKKYRTLNFAGKEIELSKKGKETDAVLILESLIDVENDEWKHNDEILNEWGYNDDDIKNVPKNKIYFAGKKVNNAVALKTQVDDFIEYNTSKARINPKYKKLMNSL